MTTTAARTLTGLRAEWDKPFLADPGDAKANAAWSTLTRELAAAILAADLHDGTGRTRVGDMFITRAGWSKERAAAAAAVAKLGTPEWMAALGTHENVTLTSDGQGAVCTGWCQCGGEPRAAEWIRYEYWTAVGCEAHGFVHSECRRLLQTG
jgi:hypothetical protein